MNFILKVRIGVAPNKETHLTAIRFIIFNLYWSNLMNLLISGQFLESG
jgi:hypothetical protein